jgi:hypothetical protein
VRPRCHGTLPRGPSTFALGMRVLGDTIGLVVLLLPLAIYAWLAPPLTAETTILLWAGSLALGLTGWVSWRHKSAPQRPTGWLTLAGLTVLGGVLSFAIDVVIGRANHPDLPLIAAAQSADGPFGFVATVVAFPAAFLIAVAGLVRCAFLARARMPNNRWKGP